MLKPFLDVDPEPLHELLEVRFRKAYDDDLSWVQRVDHGVHLVCGPESDRVIPGFTEVFVALAIFESPRKDRDQDHGYHQCRVSSSRMCSRWATISAWAAHGVAAQISGGRGRSVSSMDRGIVRHRPSCNARLSGGSERL